ncbi:hypothetical protein [Marinobacter nauticus]|uniref:Uncharacterized protein n=1 Tax=Marinobacter nauticus TaxID=2743 RepID=A0A833NBM7_MARNT|nr:hypothetical protein [Marinobacter nauticus]KAE8546185.1 hypothetical protein F6453_1431 [Marinobacter nauticus]
MFTFHNETSAAVQAAITTAYRTGARVRVWLGDTATGAAWTSEFDVLGYIGCSMGPVKIPLLIHNRRSMGGGGLLDHCIVRIDTTDGQTLYKHPEFSTGDWKIKYNNGPVSVLNNGELYADFENEKKARDFIAFMRGERYSK